MTHVRTPVRLLAAVLLAFTLQSLIPAGFMPAGDGSLSLMICPDGLPPGLLPAMQGRVMPDGMGMPGHQGHGHGVTDDSHCSFCTGFGAAPPSQLPTTLLLLLAGIAIVVVTTVAPGGIRLVHLPQARAPPARL